MRLVECRLGFFLDEPAIHSRQDQQRQQCRGDQTANNDGREGPLHFSARAGRHSHGDKPEAGDKSRHEHRAQPGDGSLKRRLLHVKALIP